MEPVALVIIAAIEDAEAGQHGFAAFAVGAGVAAEFGIVGMGVAEKEAGFAMFPIVPVNGQAMSQGGRPRSALDLHRRFHPGRI